MTRLYNRECRLSLTHPSTATNDWFGRKGNQVTITGLRVQFEIRLSISKHPNSAEITVTNLNKDSRAEFQQRPLTVTLEAGYDGDLRHLFQGDLRYAHSTLNTPDWETKLQIADGDRAFRQARINKSYAAKTPVLTVVKDLASQLGLAVPPEISQTDLISQFQTQLQSGAVFSGQAQAEMTRVLDRFACHWSIQNGKLLIQRDSDFSPGQAIVVSKASGLKGSIDMGVPDKEGTKKGNQVSAKGKMALYPGMYPGGLIKIESREVNGFFKLKVVTHKGDTHGDDWDTSFEAIAI